MESIKANWGTVYRLVMSQGRSEKNIEKIKAEFEGCQTDEERSAVLRKYQGSVKSAGQNKALGGEGDTKEEGEIEHKRTRNEAGEFLPDDPNTPDTNEAFSPPKPVKLGLFGKKKSGGKKG